MKSSLSHRFCALSPSAASFLLLSRSSWSAKREFSTSYCYAKSSRFKGVKKEIRRVGDLTPNPAQATPPLESLQAPSSDTTTHIRTIDLTETKPYPNNDLSTTRPARLRLPDELLKDDFDGPIPITERAKYLFRLGKAYLGFYKTGFKNIWSNYKEYQIIKKKLGRWDINTAVKLGSRSKEDVPSISRREYNLYLRTKHDLWKLLPFGLVFAICGEFTPLVIVALGPSVVPYTCRIPKQMQQINQKKIDRAKEYGSIQKEVVSQNWDFLQGRLDTDLQLSQLRALAYLLGITWSYQPVALLEPYLFNRWGPRLTKAVDNLICDTILIEREGGLAKLEPEEIAIWAMQGGAPFAFSRSWPGNENDIRSTVKAAMPELEDGLEAKLRYLWGLKIKQAPTYFHCQFLSVMGEKSADFWRSELDSHS